MTIRQMKIMVGEIEEIMKLPSAGGSSSPSVSRSDIRRLHGMTAFRRGAR